mmetsp:Transcript_57181/g.94047  ORF Transcript_57181/g.94047 Transcript_57181/m.94047 type:complete len:87 (-) Transcript_57181:123-383(-)
MCNQQVVTCRALEMGAAASRGVAELVHYAAKVPWENLFLSKPPLRCQQGCNSTQSLKVPCSQTPIQKGNIFLGPLASSLSLLLCFC